MQQATMQQQVMQQATMQQPVMQQPAMQVGMNPSMHAGMQQQQQAYQMPTPPAPKTTGSWSEHSDGSGNSYWYNSATGQSQWEKPF